MAEFPAFDDLIIDKRKKETKSHKVVPIEEAVSDLKEQLKSDLKSLQDKKNKYKQSHTVVPVEEAVSDLKEQLKSDLKSLQDKKNKYKQDVCPEK
ncbi:hypothetical protein INR49_000838 [Caranx melampygus]|nr:hypothetical protein INR49_000838 [Caranx melampygus]